MIVLDSSVLVAALVEVGPLGEWAESLAISGLPCTPELALIEVGNILRRMQLNGSLRPERAEAAHRDLLALPVTIYPYEPLANRAWALRANLTSYDACYVALAEQLGAPLATLDLRLSRAPGPACPFLVFE